MADLLDKLFEKISKGATLLTPQELQRFSDRVCQDQTQGLLTEALETFENRSDEDVELEAFTARTFRNEILADLKKSRLGSAAPVVNKYFGDNEVGALHACFKQGISKENFQKLKEASLKVFPKLELFTGWGIYAQNFEGQILKNVMLEGVKQGIVCLPVHDAVAVPLDEIGWTCEEMSYQWDKRMEVAGLARVTIDTP